MVPSYLVDVCQLSTFNMWLLSDGYEPYNFFHLWPFETVKISRHAFLGSRYIVEVGRLSDVDVGCGFLVGALLGLRLHWNHVTSFLCKHWAVSRACTHLALIGFRELDLSLTYAQRNDVFVWVLPLHLGCSTGMYVRTAGLLLPAPEEYLGASFLLLPSFNEGSMGVYMVQFCLVTVWPLESSWFPTSPAAAEQIRCSSFWVSLGFAWPWKHKAGVLWWPLVVHGF